MSYAYIRELTVQREGEIVVDGLPVHAGDRVEVFVIRRGASSPNGSRYPLHGTPLRYDGPFDPAILPEE